MEASRIFLPTVGYKFFSLFLFPFLLPPLGGPALSMERFRDSVSSPREFCSRIPSIGAVAWVYSSFFPNVDLSPQRREKGHFRMCPAVLLWCACSAGEPCRNRLFAFRPYTFFFFLLSRSCSFFHSFSRLISITTDFLPLHLLPG